MAQSRKEQEGEYFTSTIADRNSEFFEDEVDKLDKWAEDVKRSLESSSRQLDIDIKTMKTNARTGPSFGRKSEAQWEIKDLERSAMI